MYHVPLAVQCIYGKKGKNWMLSGLLYADDLVLCGELEEEPRAMMEQFVEVCRSQS